MKEKVCPHCGNTEFVTTKQSGYADVISITDVLKTKRETIYHVICLHCGTIVRSYINEPQKFKNNKSV